MTRVLILSANGQPARNTVRIFLRDTDAASVKDVVPPGETLPTP